VNWVAMVRVAEHGPLPGTASWNTPGRADEVLDHLGHWDLGWLDVPALISGSPEILEYPMVDKEPLACWGAGRVTLLGDAAHPMYPVGPNGGTQAILDAQALAVGLAHDSPVGLADYEHARRAATTQIITANRQMHDAGDPRCATVIAAITATYRTATGADDVL